MLNRDHCRVNYSNLLKELVEVKKAYLPLLSTEFQDQFKKLAATQESFKDDKAFNAAARLTRFLHKDYLNFLKDLDISGDNSRTFSLKQAFEHTPIMIPSKTVGKVYVFPNLVVDNIDNVTLKNICWVIGFDSLETFNEIRRKKPNSWQPFFRAWTKIKKYEEISITRALMRHTNIQKELSTKQVNALVASYLELIKPLELLHAEEPKDYVEMFKAGGNINTCMTSTDNKRKCWKEILKHDHHPASLFAYHPYIKGIYCIKDKKVVARTFLYQNTKGKWQYGRVFQENKFYGDKFLILMREKGYTALTNTFSRKASFVVPGLYNKQKDKYFLPVPYMDNVANDLRGEFDLDKKEFKLFFKSRKESNISTSSTGGYIEASSLSNIRCTTCGARCSSPHTAWNSRAVFCGVECAACAGYKYVLTSSGEAQLRIATECYVDYFDDSTIFTNRNSCINNGGVRVIHDFKVKGGK